MPELPEVQTVLRTLQPAVVGATIRQVLLHRRDIVTPAGCDLPARLRAQRIASLTRRGKRLIFTLDSGATFYIHLGMTGRLLLQSPDDPPIPHTHLELRLSSTQAIRFVDPRRFGGLWWIGRDGVPDAGMGPEPLTLTPRQLAQRLTRTRRPIKCALLDQRLIAGLGNIYVDESLFAARIHPLTPSDQLAPSQIGKLTGAIKLTLRQAIAHRGSTLRDYRDGNDLPGGFQKLHRVYGRENHPCARCRTPIARIVLGGRSTHFCPACQKPPALTDHRPRSRARC